MDAQLDDKALESTLAESLADLVPDETDAALGTLRGSGSPTRGGEPS